jgi:hypothetical protein
MVNTGKQHNQYGSGRSRTYEFSTHSVVTLKYLICRLMGNICCQPDNKTLCFVCTLYYIVPSISSHPTSLLFTEISCFLCILFYAWKQLAKQRIEYKCTLVTKILYIARCIRQGNLFELKLYLFCLLEYRL